MLVVKFVIIVEKVYNLLMLFLVFFYYEDFINCIIFIYLKLDIYVIKFY